MSIELRYDAYESLHQVLVALESSSSLSHRRRKSTNLQSQQFDQASIICSQRSRKRIAEVLESTHDRESSFVISDLSSRSLIYLSSSYCFSKSCTLLFCFSLSFSDFERDIDRDEKSQLINLLRSCCHRHRYSDRHRCSNQASSIRKWFSIYKIPSDLLSFFLLSYRCRSDDAQTSRLFATSDSEEYISTVNSVDERRRAFRFHETSISLKKNSVTMQIRVE